ncbi:hypothetical protein GCM10025864_39180 [Luteimicrobium album]|uniref:Nif11 domain-containing protein n=1 Tax=Luteimicrobium album TaxID=1054550 RepID=A0ABQ6I835_9MICO|nr:hypothetical protein [Luteimicrobium album]GMA26159.1 hypothetical protein GCM10025864_39180 [Luteimicrobium album]
MNFLDNMLAAGTKAQRFVALVANSKDATLGQIAAVADDLGLTFSIKVEPKPEDVDGEAS